MDDLNKTKEELLKDLQELRQEYYSMKASFDKFITEQKDSMYNMEVSEKQFKSIIESTNDFIWTVDPIHFGLQTFNSRLRNNFLETRNIKVARGMTPHDLYPSEKFTQTWNDLYKRVLQEGSYTTEYEGQTAEHFMEITFNLIKLNGKVVSISAFGRDITERKKTEKEFIEAKVKAEENEELFRSTFEQAAVGVAHVGMDGQFLRINKRFCEILGYSQSEMMSFSFQDITHPDSLNNDLLNAEKLRTNQIETYNTEKRYIRKDKSYVWVNITVSLLRDSSGESKYFITIAEDITERKQAEEALRKSEERLRQAQAIAAIGNWEIDLKTWKVSLSESALKILGIESETGEVLHELVKSIALKAYRERLDEANRQLITANIPYDQEYEIKRQNDGKVRWIYTKAAITEFSEGIASKAVGVIQDITESKQIKEKLEESEIRFRTLSENELVGVYILEQGKMTYVNPELAHIFGYEQAELIGAPPLKVIHPDDHALVIENIRRRAEGEVEKLQYEFHGLCKNGEIKNIEVRGCRITLNNEIALIGNIMDITQRKQSEKALHEVTSRLSEVLENSLDASYKRDLQTNTYEYLSSVFTKITGYSQKEMNILPLEKVLELMHPDDIPETNRIIAEALSGPAGNAYNVTYRFKCKEDGTYRWILDKFTVMHNEGKPVALIVSVSDITQSKHMEELVKERTHELQKVSERHTLAVRAANIGIWDWDVVNDVLIWDNKMYELYGILQEDFGGAYEAWSQAIYSDDKVYTEGELQAALDGKREYKPEFRIVWPDGSIHYIQAYALTFHFPDGKPNRMVGINFDITERKNTEKALKENESRFRTFIEHAPVAIGVFHLNGLGFYANNKFLDALGLQNLDEMIGRPAHEYFIPQFREDSKERTQRRLKGLPVPLVYESVALRSDGSEFPVQLAVAPIQLSDRNASIAFLFDLTEIRQAEKKLMENEELFRHVFQYATAGVCLVGTNGRFIRVNDALQKIIGYTEGEIVNCTFDSITYPEDVPLGSELFKKMLSGDIEKATIEKRFLRKDGKIILAIVSSTIMRPDNLKPYFISHVIDITDIKESEEKLRISEERFRSLYLHSPLPYQSVDENAILIDVNPAWLTTLEYNKDEVIGKNFTDFVLDEHKEQFVTSYSAMKADGYIHNAAFDLVCKSGKIINTIFDGSSRQGEFHPKPLTEPYLIVSHHTALHNNLMVTIHISNVQTT